jgi:hypothetical protein
MVKLHWGPWAHGAHLVHPINPSRDSEKSDGHPLLGEWTGTTAQAVDANVDGYDIHSSPWKIPTINGILIVVNSGNIEINVGFVRWENHLFRLGPWQNHGEL